MKKFIILYPICTNFIFLVIALLLIIADMKLHNHPYGDLHQYFFSISFGLLGLCIYGYSNENRHIYDNSGRKPYFKTVRGQRVFVVIEKSFPTIHSNKDEAIDYVNFVRMTSKQHKNLKAMFCYFTARDLKENFANCNFESI